MKVHMAVVVDEKRKPVGVVTMEDVFNALFEG
jgi:CBS domain containing-hemolysin-like protein